MSQNVFSNYFSESQKYDPNTVESLVEDMLKVQKKMSKLVEFNNSELLKNQLFLFNKVYSKILNEYDNENIKNNTSDSFIETDNYKVQVLKIKQDFDKHKYSIYEYTNSQDVNDKVIKYIKELYKIFKDNKMFLSKIELNLFWEFIQQNKSCRSIKTFSDNFNNFVESLK